MDILLVKYGKKEETTIENVYHVGFGKSGALYIMFYNGKRKTLRKNKDFDYCGIWNNIKLEGEN